MAGKARRVSVGFQGGQVLSLRLSDEQLDALSRALVGASGWHDVDSEDGPVRIDLGSVVYVSADKAESHVGFG